MALQRLLAASDDTADLNTLVERELRKRLVGGQLRNNDLIQLQRTAALRERVEADREPEDARLIAVSKNLMELLALTAPHMVAVNKTEIEHEAQTARIQGWIASQQIANGSPVAVATEEGELDRLIKRKVAGGA